MKIKFIEKYYTVIVITLQLLNMYMFNENFTFGDMSLFLLYFFFLISIIFNLGNGWKFKISYTEMLPYIICVTSWCIMSYVSLEISVFFRNARYLLYLITLFFFTRKYFNYSLGLKVYEFVGFFSTIYLFIQYIFRYLFDIYLLNYLPFLELSAYGIKTIIPVRCKSIFSEPSIYSIYIIGLLALLLIKVNKNKFEKCLIGICSLGVAISASTTGILCWVALFILYGIYQLFIIRKISKSKLSLILALISLGAVILIFMLAASGIGSYIVNRIILGNSARARFESYTMTSGFQNLVIGNGMHETNGVYLNGIVRCIYYFGYIGLLAFVFLTMGQLLKSKWENKILVIIFLGINIGSEVMFGPILLLFYSFIMINLRGSIRKKCLSRKKADYTAQNREAA